MISKNLTVNIPLEVFLIHIYLFNLILTAKRV